MALASELELLRSEHANGSQRLQAFNDRLQNTETKLNEVDERARRAIDLTERILQSRIWRVLTTIGGVMLRLTSISSRKP
jgi:hypothetical protein